MPEIGIIPNKMINHNFWSEKSLDVTNTIHNAVTIETNEITKAYFLNFMNRNKKATTSNAKMHI